MKMKTFSAMIEIALAVTAMPAFAGQGPSSSAAPYLQAVAPKVEFTSLLTTGDTAGNGYRMVGVPDGLGAFDNHDGSFTLLMNHELNGGVGVARAHNAPDGKGAFISAWVIDKKNLRVLSGEDLIKTVYGWDTSSQTSAAVPSIVNFNRFCSADLPPRSAFYNAKSGLGSKARIFLNGEEGGSSGYALAHIASGADKGNTFVLGKFNLATNGSGINAVGGWENLLANPRSGDKTVVIGNNDGGTGIMTNSIAVYVGAKTAEGSEVDKAGLTNGSVKFVKVAGFADNNGATNEEINDSTARTTGIASGTPFTLSDTEVTTFSRPEDGAWADSRTYYFATTDQIDKTDLAGGIQKGGTRLWRLNFNKNFDGGSIDVLIDSSAMAGGVGVDKPNMFDNIGVNADGTLVLLEDVGNNQHNGKIWQFDPRNGKLTMLGKFDPALFGDIGPDGVFTAGSHTQDEETSGVIDVTRLLRRHGNKRYNLLVAQDHTPSADVELVEGGQLLLMSSPKGHAMKAGK